MADVPEWERATGRQKVVPQEPCADHRITSMEQLTVQTCSMHARRWLGKGFVGWIVFSQMEPPKDSEHLGKVVVDEKKGTNQ